MRQLKQPYWKRSDKDRRATQVLQQEVHFLQPPLGISNLIMYGAVRYMQECRWLQKPGLRSPRDGADRAGVLPCIGLGTTLESPARVVCAFNHWAPL